MKWIDYTYFLLLLFFPVLLFAQAADTTETNMPEVNSVVEDTLQVPADSTVIDSTAITEMLPDSTLQDSLLAREPVEIDSSQLPVDIPVVRAHIADSTLYRGLDHGSFDDVFDWLPGTYNADLGNVGNHSKGSMFAGVPGEFDLMYGFLSLNDPLTSHADMNQVPVEGVGDIHQVTGHAQQDAGYTNLGQTLLITPLDIAVLPPRTIVTYRTGNSSFTDVDVRLGLRTSQKMTINMGGIIKQYVGLLDYNRYDGQKVNFMINRQLTRNITLDYMYLQNKSELDVPVLQYLENSNISSPHETIKRSDQGLAVKYGRMLTTTLQYSNYRRDYYEMQFGDYSYYTSHQVKHYRVSSQLRRKIIGLEFQTGFMYDVKDLASEYWGGHLQKRTDGWFQTSLNHEWITASAGLRSSYLDEFGKDFVLPEVTVTWQPNKQITGFAWNNKYVRPPSFENLYVDGPFYSGNPGLQPAEYTQTGIGTEFSYKGINAYVSASAINIHNQCAIYADEDTSYSFNQIDHNRYSIDGALGYEWKYGLSVYAKGKYLWVSSDDEYFDITNYPAGYGKGFIQYHNIFFQRDLDLTVRLGGTLLGEMFTPEYYYAQYPLSLWITDPQIVPYVHVKMKIRTMTFFFSFQNPLDADYQRVFPYPMPQSEFRWGFNWMFFD